MELEYANAYSEVLEILSYLSKEDYEKIPKEKIGFFENNCNKNYKFSYDINKTLDEQNVSKKAKIIIAILFRDHWATDEQRAKIKAKEEHDRTKIKNKSDFHNKKVNENLPIEIKRETYFQKIIKFFKKLLKMN